MRYFLASLFMVLAMLCGASTVSLAAEDEKAPAAKNEVLQGYDDFAKDLDEPSKRHFTVLYGNYNMIQVVESVQDNVGLAVEACGEKNPDLKDPLAQRFDAWKSAIKPVMSEAEANVSNMILAQEYAKPADIRKFFKLVDKARKTQDKEVKKIPVTSQEACENVLKKMDETQDNMVRLLEATLISLPRVMQAEDDEAKAKAEAKAQEEAEKAKAEEEAARAEAEAKKASEETEEEAAEDQKSEEESKDGSKDSSQQEE